MAFYDIYLLPRSLGGSGFLGFWLSQEDRLTEELLLLCLGWGLVGSQLFYFVYCTKGSFKSVCSRMKAWKWENKLGFFFLYTAVFTSQHCWQKQTEERNSLRAMLMHTLPCHGKFKPEGSVQYGAKGLTGAKILLLPVPACYRSLLEPCNTLNILKFWKSGSKSLILWLD